MCYLQSIKVLLTINVCLVSKHTVDLPILQPLSWKPSVVQQALTMTGILEVHLEAPNECGLEDPCVISWSSFCRCFSARWCKPWLDEVSSWHCLKTSKCLRSTEGEGRLKTPIFRGGRAVTCWLTFEDQPTSSQTVWLLPLDVSELMW